MHCNSFKHYLKLGRIKPHSDIKAFLGDKLVEFNDGTRAEFDLIICATGYHTSVPGTKTSYIICLHSFEAIHYMEEQCSQFDCWNYGAQTSQCLLFWIWTGTFGSHLISHRFQPRYGFGPLFTMQGSFVATLIRTQAKMKHSLSDLFAKFTSPLQKAKNSLDVLVDPHVEHKKYYIYRALVPWVPSLEWLLYKFI